LRGKSYFRQAVGRESEVFQEVAGEAKEIMSHLSWRTKNTLLTILVGMIALLILQVMFH